MKPSRKHERPLVLGSESIAYTVPEAVAQNTIYDTVPVTNSLGHEGSGDMNKGKGDTGGRSEKVLPPAKVTAKPLPAVSQSSPKPLLSPPSPKPADNPQSDMPVLGDSMGVHQKEEGQVVQSYPQVPFTPQNEPPLDTNEVKVSSPFITGNERIDRRTAFTQYCRDGEGRTYMKVAERMGVPLESIKKWANEDNWENAYRERATADVLQVAKEENIHEVLDIRREVIAQLKQKILDSKNGKEVFRNTKEMLDTMLKLEELTGAKDAGSVRAGQIFVIIDKEEWEAREKMNESARKEEANA
jgi:hypothetical protein